MLTPKTEESVFKKETFEKEENKLEKETEETDQLKTETDQLEKETDQLEKETDQLEKDRLETETDGLEKETDLLFEKETNLLEKETDIKTLETNETEKTISLHEFIQEFQKTYSTKKWQIVKEAFGYEKPNPNIKFKTCTFQVLVIIECFLKHNDEEGQTNESRQNVSDSRFAKFRATKLFVNRIYNVKKKSWLESYTNQYRKNRNHKIRCEYQVGKWVIPDSWEPNEDVVCGGGIHYFNTLQGAYFYSRYDPQMHFHSNGSLDVISPDIDGCEMKSNTVPCYSCALFRLITKRFDLDHLISDFPKLCESALE